MGVFLTKYTTNIGGLLVDWDVFNMVSEYIGLKAVKMDDVAVPLNNWNHRLVINYPKPETL